MEHRWNPRRLVTAKVILSSAAFGPKWARIEDIGAGGACVEVEGATLPANLHVEVIFIWNEGGVLQIRRVPALIVWTSSNLAGLMFYEIGPPIVVAVMNALAARDRVMDTDRPADIDGPGTETEQRSRS